MRIISNRNARRGNFGPIQSSALTRTSDHWAKPINHVSCSAFTLVEIMIVVVIIGLLAVMALPAFERARFQTQNTRLINDLRQFRGAFETYNLENGAWPADVNEGELPTEMEGYLTADAFTKRTVVGGNYDWEGPGAFSYGAGISIRGSHLDSEQGTSIDGRIDDGNLGAGDFIFSDNAYTLIIEQ